MVKEIYTVDVDMPEIYTVGVDMDKKFYVKGPGPGNDYYGGFLYQHTRWVSETHAKRAALIANGAYAEGYAQALVDVRKALGFEK